MICKIPCIRGTFFRVLKIAQAVLVCRVAMLHQSNNPPVVLSTV